MKNIQYFAPVRMQSREGDNYTVVFLNAELHQVQDPVGEQVSEEDIDYLGKNKRSGELVLFVKPQRYDKQTTGNLDMGAGLRRLGISIRPFNDIIERCITDLKSVSEFQNPLPHIVDELFVQMEQDSMQR